MDTAREQGIAFLKEVSEHQEHGKTKKTVSENDAGCEYCLQFGFVKYDKRRKGVYITDSGERMIRSLKQA